MLHLLDVGRQVRIFRLVPREQRGPAGASRSATRADAGGEVLAHAVGDQELRVLRPAVAALGEADFLLAERFPVGGGGVVLVRSTVADVAVQDDERRTSLRLPEATERLLDTIEIVGV